MMAKDGGGDDLVTDLVVAVFRLNGTLLETGNDLVGELGLTTAWWQVLGALSRSPAPIPVAHIARNMGLSRQSVQRNVDLLASKGMVQFAPNPHHQRAKLVVLTPAGTAAADAADARQRPLGERLVTSIGRERMAAALAVLGKMDALLSGAASGSEDLKQKEVAA